MRYLIALLLLWAPVDGMPSQRIGQPLVLTDVYIPGGEAKPAPRRDRDPSLMVRLLEVKPAQDGFRYDFEIQGLDAGTHDLAKFLIAADPAVPPRFPEIPVEITGKLSSVQLPDPGGKTEIRSPGGYMKTMMVLGVLWVAGLAGILLWRRKAAPRAGAKVDAPTLAERLRPLIDRAAAGDLDASGRAAMERLILGHWRAKIPEIASASSPEAMTALRKHPDASPLVLALERWLHAPGGHVAPAELERLLAPYR